MSDRTRVKGGRHATWVGLWLLACARAPNPAVTASGKPTGTRPAHSASVAQPAAAPSDAERFRSWLASLHQSQVNGWLDGAMDRYVGHFSSNARIVAARGPTPGPYDVTFTRAAFAELMRVQGVQPVRAAFSIQEPSLEFEAAQTKQDGDVFTLEQIRVFRGLEIKERVHERFTLEPSGDAWQVVALWYYPLSAEGLGDLSFAQAKLAELDAKANAPGLEPLDRAYALFTALHYAEAADAYCTLAAEPNAKPELWVHCGHSALFAADPARARAAFASAEQRDPLLRAP